MSGIEPLVVLPVAALHLSVMPGRIGADQFMPYPVFLQMFLKKGWFIPMGSEAVGELRSIVGLDTFNRAGKCLYKVFHKLRGRIGAVFLKGFYKAPSGILIDGWVLKELFSKNLTVFQAGGGNKFDIHLDALSRMIHLLIRLGDVFGVGRMNSHNALLFEEAVKTGNGAFIATLHEFYPENDQTGMRIAPAHIPDEFDLFKSVLVWMGMRTSGTIAQGIPGTIVTVFPTINVLTVGFILHSSFGNPIAVCVVNK